jgi:methyltransferase (TIGR00027 family)
MDRASVTNNIARTAHLTAWMRTLARATAGANAANGDYLAERFLLPPQRRSLRAPRLTRWFVERAMPGALGYFNARTRYFDEALLYEANAGIDQLVLLGAGFDTRPVRFAKELAKARIFEVDMPQVLDLRVKCLPSVSGENSVPVPIDFERDDLAQKLVERGFVSAGQRTVFLWEGVTFYLQPEAVDSVLARIALLGAPGSSLVFDYVTQAFVRGDHDSYGAKRLAQGWKKLGNVNRSGVADVGALLKPHGLLLRSEIDALELERRYLAGLPGGALRAWGPLRIAHAERV